MISLQAGGPAEMPESSDIVPVRATIFEVGSLCDPGWPFTHEGPASVLSLLMQDHKPMPLPPASSIS